MGGGEKGRYAGSAKTDQLAGCGSARTPRRVPRRGCSDPGPGPGTPSTGAVHPAMPVPISILINHIIHFPRPNLPGEYSTAA